MRWAVIVLVAGAQAALAQLTDVWPLWQHPARGKEAISQVYSAAVEVCSAVGVAPPSAPAWYQTSRTDLQNIKTAIKAALPQYVNEYVMASNRAAALNQATNAPVGLGGNADFPKWTLAEFYAWRRLPTNVLDVTPFTAISGLGPFTNDQAAVGRPHGWLVTTGGTNFPSGRTNWYTTDYGVDAVLDVVTNLRYVSFRGFDKRALRRGLGSTNNSPSRALAAADAIAGATYATNSRDVFVDSYTEIDDWIPGSSYQATWLARELEMASVASVWTNSAARPVVVEHRWLAEVPESPTAHAYRWGGDAIGLTGRGAWVTGDEWTTTSSSPYGYQTGAYARVSGNKVVVTIGSTNWASWVLDSAVTNLVIGYHDSAGITGGKYNQVTLLDWRNGTNGFIWR